MASNRETVRLYEVGGYVRDGLLGVVSKDIDYAVEAASFDAMRQYLIDTGMTIFLEQEEHLTIRARFPRGHAMSHVTADFVLCRKDGTYSDGRRPDSVESGSIYDDLARRDFTVNAIARDTEGNYLDPHGGREDLQSMILRCVGSAEARLREDSLRALRALRFAITKGFDWDGELDHAMASHWLPPLLSHVSVERKREELLRCFQHSSLETMYYLHFVLTEEFREACFEGGLWLMPTLRA